MFEARSPTTTANNFDYVELHKKRSARIWSPPTLQDTVYTLTGTGLRPHIRPISEEITPLTSM